MSAEGIITTAGVSMLLLEIIKSLIKAIGKKPEFGYPVWFYLISLPVLNAVVPFGLVWLGVDVVAPTLGMTFIEVVKYIIVSIVGGVLTSGLYNLSVPPLKERAQEIASLKRRLG